MRPLARDADLRGRKPRAAPAAVRRSRLDPV